MEAVKRMATMMVLPLMAWACGDSPAEPPPGDASIGGSAAAGGAGSGGADDIVVTELGDPLERLDTIGPPGPHFLQSALHDDVLYVCSGRKALSTYDVSDPAQMVLLDELLLSVGKRCQYVAIDPATNHAIVTHAQDQLNPQSLIAAIDISDPSNLSETVLLPRSEQPAGVAVDGGLVAVAAKADGLLLFTWNGESFAELGSVDVGDAWNLRLQDGMAYVALGSDGLRVVDLNDPDAPAMRGAVDLQGISKDLVIDGDRAYVALGGEGIAAIDISDPDSPKLLDWETTPGSSTAIAFSPEASALFVADWNDIRMFDVSNRDDPFPLGREALPLGNDRDARTMGIASQGNYVFSSNWDELASYRFNPGLSAPDLVLSPTVLQLPDALPGESTTGALVLSNDGPHDITELGIAATNGLSFGELPTSIAAFSETVVEVTYSASDAQPFSGTLTITSDDIDQPTQSLDVTANQLGLGMGDAVPEWSWADLDGGEIALSHYPNQVVMLAYFSTF